MEPSWTKLTHPDHTTIIAVHVDESLFWLQTGVCKPSQPTQQHVSCLKENGNSQILESKLVHAHYHQCNRYKAVFFLLRKNRPGIEANTNISNTVLYTDLTFLNLKVTCTYVYNHAAHTTWSSTSGIMTVDPQTITDNVKAIHSYFAMSAIISSYFWMTNMASAVSSVLQG